MKAIKDLSPEEVQREWRNAKRRDSKALDTIGKHTQALREAASSSVDVTLITYGGDKYTADYASAGQARKEFKLVSSAWKDLGVLCELDIDDANGKYNIIFTFL